MPASMFDPAAGNWFALYDFRIGVAAALREDPDVILLGELRDSEKSVWH